MWFANFWRKPKETVTRYFSCIENTQASTPVLHFVTEAFKNHWPTRLWKALNIFLNVMGATVYISYCLEVKSITFNISVFRDSSFTLQWVSFTLLSLQVALEGNNSVWKFKWRWGEPRVVVMVTTVTLPTLLTSLGYCNICIGTNWFLNKLQLQLKYGWITAEDFSTQNTYLPFW